jgi:hypothetical protein
LTIRECRVRVKQPGFRCQTVIVATTLLDADEVTKEDLAQLYRARWNGELDPETNPANGHLALQNARARPEGALDTHSGL